MSSVLTSRMALLASRAKKMVARSGETPTPSKWIEKFKEKKVKITPAESVKLVALLKEHRNKPASKPTTKDVEAAKEKVPSSKKEPRILDLVGKVDARVEAIQSKNNKPSKRGDSYGH